MLVIKRHVKQSTRRRNLIQPKPSHHSCLPRAGALVGRQSHYMVCNCRKALAAVLSQLGLFYLHLIAAGTGQLRFVSIVSHYLHVPGLSIG